jgi:hypothetical protein
MPVIVWLYTAFLLNVKKSVPDKFIEVWEGIKAKLNPEEQAKFLIGSEGTLGICR